MKAQYPSVTLKKLQELRAKYPMNPGIPTQMGILYGEQKNFEEAFLYLEIAASMQPNNPSHVYNMAIVAERMGDASKAVKLYEQALQMDASYGSEANSLPREVIYDRLVILRRKV
jgi:tetratricopeptide (TPR) repeat protein